MRTKSIFFAIIAAMLPVFSSAQHYSLTWKNFNVRDDTGLEVLGMLNTRPSDGTGDSYWSVGCETLDRDFGIFSEYSRYVGELGVGYARIQSGWAKCEPEKGKYDFEWLDAIVDGLIEQGVKPWMCLCYGNPVYNDEGTDLGSAIFTSKKAMDGWCRYVEAVVKRYKGRIAMYEVWNEPNLGKNKEHPDRYAALFTNTARVIRKNDPEVKIAGLSLSGSMPLDFAEQVLGLLKDNKGLEYLQYVTFHPYYPNPDDATGKILELRRLVKSYNPDTKLLQGETGCPSILEWGHALSYYEWTEYSQVKWNLRRMANDFILGIPSSVFTMIDLQYKNMLQSFGLIRMNLLKKFVYKRPSFYGVRNMANLLSTSMTPYSEGLEIEAATEKGISFCGLKKDGQPAGFMLWLSDAIPSDSIEKEEITVTVKGLTMRHPVLLDPITGKIYSMKSIVYRGGNEAGRLKITGLPLWDSPLVVIERDALDMTVYDVETMTADTKTHETFI